MPPAARVPAFVLASSLLVGACRLGAQALPPTPTDAAALPLDAPSFSARVDSLFDPWRGAAIPFTLARISDKWTMLVVRVLGRGPHRFNALRREVGEISQKVLASTLRDLETNGSSRGR